MCVNWLKSWVEQGWNFALPYGKDGDDVLSIVSFDFIAHWERENHPLMFYWAYCMYVRCMMIWYTGDWLSLQRVQIIWTLIRLHIPHYKCMSMNLLFKGWRKLKSVWTLVRFCCRSDDWIISYLLANTIVSPKIDSIKTTFLV